MMICPVCSGYGQEVDSERACKVCLGWGVLMHGKVLCNTCHGKVKSPMWCSVCKNTGQVNQVKPFNDPELAHSFPARVLKDAITKLRIGFDPEVEGKALGLVTVLLEHSAEKDGHPIQKWLKSGQIVVEPSGIWVIKGKNGVRIHEFDVEYV